jgi:Ferritin-like
MQHSLRKGAIVTTENPLIIENREELLFLLGEASQLEHMLMCEYLFAVFSLKRDVSEGITPEQLDAIKRWDRVISAVAAQEMLHLALASNMLSAIGSSAHFNRPNFPQQSNYFPSGVKVALLPFGKDALLHFLFLERPEGLEREDAAFLESRDVQEELGQPVIITVQDLVPEPEEFATVGHLYRGIEQGFRHLVEKQGEPQIFIGPPRAQATQEYFAWPELIPVTDLASAVKAIETIVEEGEGARGDWRNAHYGKFLQVYNEYLDLKKRDPNFEPTRSVKPAFVRQPADTGLVDLISDPVTAGISNLFNASYATLLSMLNRFFLHGGETGEEFKVLSDVCVDLMFDVIRPVGILLTTLPIGPNLPGMKAGASFETYRLGSHPLPHRYGAWKIIHERLVELADFSAQLKNNELVSHDLALIEANLRKLADSLAPYGGNGKQDAPLPA